MLYSSRRPISNCNLSFFELGLEVVVKAKSKLLDISHTGKSLLEDLLFAEHGENMLCKETVLNVKIYFCTQHVLTLF